MKPLPLRCTVFVFIALALAAPPGGQARAQGYVPHADTTDWRWWLHLSQNVSRQGNPEVGQVEVAQDSARALALIALAHVEPDSPAPPWARCKVLTKLGEYRYLAGDFAAARDYLLSALSVSDTSDGEGRVEREETLFRLGILAEVRPGFGTSDAPFQEARDLVRRTWQASTPDQSERVFRLAHVYPYLEFPDKFYELLEHVVRIHEAYPDSDPRWAVRALVFFAEGTSKPKIAQIRAAKDAQDSSVAFGQYALDLSEQYFGPDDTLTAYVLYRLGDYYDRKGDYDVLDSLWGRAWNIFRRTVPPEHIEYQGGLVRMGGLAYARGDFVEAERMYKDALRLRIDTQGPGHPETAAMWIRVGRVFQATARYDQADSCYAQALSIRQRALEQVESNTAQTLGMLGDVCFDRGDYPRAETYYRQAYDIRLRVHGPGHARTASSLDDLARLYLAWGNFEEAERCLDRALSAETEFLGARHPDVARTLDRLAEVQLARWETASAAQSLARADSIWPRHSKLFALEMADHYRLQGELTYREGDMRRAGKMFARSADEAAKVYSYDDPRIIPYIVRLARQVGEMGKPESALRLFSHVLRARRGTPETWHPYFADAFECYSDLLAAHGLCDSALAAADTALQIRMHNFAVNAAVMPERDALMYKQSLLACRDRLVAIHFARATLPPAPGVQFPVMVLAIKGMAAQLTANRKQKTATSRDPGCDALADTLLSLRAHAFRLYTAAPAGDAERSIRELAQIMDDIHELERRQVQGCERGSARLEATLPALADLQRPLRAGEALLEYIRYRRDDRDCYAAVVLNAGGDLHAVDLGEAAPIDDAVGAYRRHMLRVAAAGAPPGEDDLAQYRVVAGALADRVWKPAAHWLAESQRILIVPDGALNLVSFAGLPSGTERYLVEDVEIHYLNSVRAITDPPGVVVDGNDLLAMGDPDFNATADARKAAFDDSGGAALRSSGYLATHSVRSACPGASDSSLAPLPGTERELGAAARAWSAHGAAVHLFTGPSASEDLFKRYASGARVLHLATHGYYALGQCTPDDPGELALHHWVAHENPLLLSGIYLAGANLNGRGAAEAGVDDGILTAAEVSDLDLTGTQMVVLSSCESGVGDVRAGEGVYDLRRAFMQAGASAVVSALWPVGDDEAAAFIGALYSDWNRSLSFAMRKAALERLSDLRHRHQPDHPFEWAGFVATGSSAGLIGPR